MEHACVAGSAHPVTTEPSGAQSGIGVLQMNEACSRAHLDKDRARSGEGADVER